MDALIDPRSTPYSSREEIAAEIEEIRRLPSSPGRDHVLAQMQAWLDDEEPAES